MSTKKIFDGILIGENSIVLGMPGSTTIIDGISSGPIDTPPNGLKLTHGNVIGGNVKFGGGKTHGGTEIVGIFGKLGIFTINGGVSGGGFGSSGFFLTIAV